MKWPLPTHRLPVVLLLALALLRSAADVHAQSSKNQQYWNNKDAEGQQRMANQERFRERKAAEAAAVAGEATIPSSTSTQAQSTPETRGVSPGAQRLVLPPPPPPPAAEWLVVHGFGAKVAALGAEGFLTVDDLKLLGAEDLPGLGFSPDEADHFLEVFELDYPASAQPKAEL